MNSREKGKRGELELAAIWRREGYNTRRGQQYCGASGDADVIGLPGLHVECKRVERLDLYAAIAQAKHDAQPGKLPVVMHRKNNAEWLATLPLEAFAEIYREWEASKNAKP